MLDLQAEYDNGAKVPGFQDIVEGWRAAAAGFRARHPHTELGIGYGSTERQALDLFWPDARRMARVVIFVHGGYWQRLHRDVFSHLAQGLLAHGIAVAMPSYDLCPQVTVATIVAQVRAAAEFLAARHGSGMLAIGHSAGGHLAAMLLAAGDGAVTRALPISGLFDLEPLTRTTVNDALGLDATEARRLSPLSIARPAGRLHAVVGGTEGIEYLRQSRSIAEAWGGTWEAAEAANHFTVVEPLADPDSPLVARARQLLD